MIRVRTKRDRIPPNVRVRSREGEEWSTAEDEIILKYYRKRGSKYAAALLGRSYSSVQARALNIGVRGYGKRWKAFEVHYLKKRYGKTSNASIARTLHRSRGSVYAKAQLLRLGRSMEPRWTERELAYLKANYHRLSNGRIAIALHRTPAAVELKAGRTNLSRRVHLLTSREKKFIVKNGGTLSFVEMGKRFGVSHQTVRNVLLAAGFRARPTSRPWTAADDAQLRKLYGTMKRREVAARIGRTMVATACRASDLGITREIKGGRRSRGKRN